MKKFLLLSTFIFFSFHQPVLAFDFYYEYLTEINRAYFLINLTGPAGKKKYLCNFENLDCVEKDINFSLKPKNFLNYFVSPDGERILAQTKFKSNQFLTFYATRDTSIFKILNFNKKIDNVFFDRENTKILIKSNDTFYLFSLKENNIQKKFTLNKPYSYLTPSPSLKYLAFYKPNNSKNNQKNFLIFNIETEETKEFLNDKNVYWDLLTENLKLFDFISDDKLIFLSDHHGYQNLYIYDITNDKITKLFSENFIVKDFIVYKNKIFFTANKENPLKWDLYEYSLENQEIKKLVDYVVYDFNLIIIRDHLFIKISNNLPPRIYLLDLSNYEIKRPKINNSEGLISLGKPQNYENNWYVLLLHEDFIQDKEYDLIVWLHGGPHQQTSLGYHPYLSYGIYDYLLEKLRKSGFLVVKIDYPGSFGYGRNFAEILKNNIGKIDVMGVLDVVKEIKKNFKVKKIYLMGNSYGGYLALKTIYDSPDMFAGAISINGVIDWWTLIKNNPRSIFSIHFNGPPSRKNISLYNQASLFLKKKKLKDKNILLIYGENDTTIPPQQNILFINSYKNIAKVYSQKLNEAHVIQKKESLEKILFMILIFTKL